MAAFIEIARLDQVPPGAGSRFTAAGRDVALFNADGSICAIDDTCPHAGGSLGMGKLDGRIVTCPVHGMKFDVTTGCFAGTSGFGVASYPVKVVDGKIMAAVS
jgi:3-phenylpropionate/trans-cinnamate dioxygenase ferredoxin subunit